MIVMGYIEHITSAHRYDLILSRQCIVETLALKIILLGKHLCGRPHTGHLLRVLGACMFLDSLTPKDIVNQRIFEVII